MSLPRRKTTGSSPLFQDVMRKSATRKSVELTTSGSSPKKSPNEMDEMYMHPKVDPKYRDLFKPKNETQDTDEFKSPESVKPKTP
jgi:hypothetical protein